MTVAVAFAIIQAAGAIEALPVDAYEAAVPELREIEARTEEEIGRLGPTEPGWATSGMSAESAIAAGTGSATEHVLGEWEAGGHGVTIPGDRPLIIPQDLRRYSVREYHGSVDYHTYHRPLPGIVIHTFGTVTRIGNAQCQHTKGIELISRQEWQDWSPPTALTAFSLARLTRDDSRTYCTIFRPAGNGRFSQLAYTPEGQPYVAANEGAQTFVPTSHAEAGARIFGTGDPPTTD